jgi:hypothetical protein
MWFQLRSPELAEDFEREHVQRLADDLEHLVSSRGMLVVRPVL